MEIKEQPIEIGKKVRHRLISYITSTPIIAFVVEGHNAVAHIRKIVGSTAPADALPGTIRGDFSFDSYNLSDAHNRPIQNLIHASETPEEAKREIGVWFTEKEIFEWKRADEHILYRRVD